MMNLMENVNPDYNSIFRMANISIPFLQLYRPTSLAVSIISGCAKIWEISHETKKEFADKEWQVISAKSSRILFESTVIALDIFFPKASLVLSCSKKIAEDVLDMSLNIYNQEGKKACVGVLKVGHTLFYVASVVKPSSTLSLISLSAQGALEFYRAWIEYSEKTHIAEAVANFLLGAIRIYCAYPHASKVKRDLFGKRATDEDLKLVMEEIRLLQEKYPERLIDFDKVLSKYNFSGTVRTNSVFGQLPDKEYTEGSTELLKSERKIERIKFENLHFKGKEIEKTQMKNILFKNVTFKNMRFIDCTFEDVKFIHSTFSTTVFVGSLFKNVSFFKCDLSSSHLVFSNFLRTIFAQSELKETSFLGSQVSKSHFLYSKLSDCFLFWTERGFRFTGSQKIQSDRPVIGLLWNYRKPGPLTIDTYRLLREDFGVIPLLIDYTMVPELSMKELIPILLQKQIALNNYFSKHSESFIMQLIKQRNVKSTPTIKNIYDYVELVLSSVDALILPGGPDVNQNLTSILATSEECEERIIFESCCTQIIMESKKPLLGICRGAQAVAAYFGATLKDVEFQKGFRKYKVEDSLNPDVQVVKNIIGDTFKAFSAHHQAVVIESIEDNPYLKVVVKIDDIPKVLTYNKDGWKGMLTQIHPEIYFSQFGLTYEETVKNRNIFTHLILEAHRHKLKKENPELVERTDLLERRISLYAHAYFNKGENFID